MLKKTKNINHTTKPLQLKAASHMNMLKSTTHSPGSSSSLLAHRFVAHQPLLAIPHGAHLLLPQRRRTTTRRIHIPTTPPAPRAQHALRQPYPHPNHPLHHRKQHNAPNGNAKTVPGHSPTPIRLHVEERVDVEALGGVRHVGEPQVAGQQEDERAEVPPGTQRGAREQDFGESEDAVERVCGCVVPRGEGRREVAGEEDRPEDDCGGVSTRGWCGFRAGG